MRERIEKKIGCTIEEFIRREVEEDDPPYEAEYPNPFSILTHEEGKFVEDIARKMYAS